MLETQAYAAGATLPPPPVAPRNQTVAQRTEGPCRLNGWTRRALFKLRTVHSERAARQLALPIEKKSQRWPALYSYPHRERVPSRCSWQTLAIVDKGLAQTPTHSVKMNDGEHTIN